MENLLAAVSANQNIELRCNTTAIDLLKVHTTLQQEEYATKMEPLIQQERCSGVFVVSEGCVELMEADNVILATGGCGDIYSNTSNPASARGDGIAMALRAGASVVKLFVSAVMFVILFHWFIHLFQKNMEFVQFHPTTLYMPGERNFLLTEALRGEGALLRDPITKYKFLSFFYN